MKSFVPVLPLPVVPVLLLLLLVASAVEGQQWTIPGLNCEFKAMDDACLRRLLDSHSTCMLYNHPCLYPQQLPVRPKEILFQKLHGISVEWTNLAIRPDNLYVLGFANGAGTWFGFKPEPDRYDIPGSIPLSFGRSYQELLGLESPGAWVRLIGLDLSMNSILETVSVLYTYDPQTNPDDDLKLAITKLVVFVCESTRFAYIEQLIYKAFDRNDGTLMDYLPALLTVNWSDISCAILGWNYWRVIGEGEVWNSTEAINLAPHMPAGLGITNVQEAFAQIYPIIQSQRCTTKGCRGVRVC